MKSKYEMLVNVLDRLRSEAPETAKKYHIQTVEGKNHGRALALVHLYLKAKFGLMQFSDRVKFVTDDAGDGGIDAYYFDETNKVLHIIQSKFRATARNFEEKHIEPDELSAIDFKRIESGEEFDEAGVKYNGKIRGLQQTIESIDDWVRWNTVVTIIANMRNLGDAAIKRLVGGYKYEVFNHLKVYNEILLPICSGQYFDAKSISLGIETDESQKTEVRQAIHTKYGDFQIRLIFIPAMEVAKNITRYKNSLMKYNPRNFLSFNKNKVNDEIRESVVNRADNLIAVLNNGITFIASSDSFTDRTGKKGVGKLTITNPQIINGGQTAYALGIIYEDRGLRPHLDKKSILAKIITPLEEGKTIPEETIEKISFANNRQSKIVEADQRSNSQKLLDLQRYLFDQHNLFFERKRGEFYEGVDLKYLDKSAIINRVELLKSAVAFQGDPAKSRVSQETIFEEESFDSIIDNLSLEELALSFLLRKSIKESKDLKGISPFGIIAAFGTCINKAKLTKENIYFIAEQASSMKKIWVDFESWAKAQPQNKKYVKYRSLQDNYYKGSTIGDDIRKYFKSNKISITYKPPARK